MENSCNRYFVCVRPSCIKEEKLIRVIKLDKYAITLFARGKDISQTGYCTPAKFQPFLNSLCQCSVPTVQAGH